MPSEDDRNRDSLISKGIRPDVVDGLSAPRRQVLVERLSTRPAADRGLFVWLVLCCAVIAIAALIGWLV